MMLTRTLNLTEKMLTCSMRARSMKKMNKSMIHNETKGASEWLTSTALKFVWALQVPWKEV